MWKRRKLHLLLYWLVLSALRASFSCSVGQKIELLKFFGSFGVKGCGVCGFHLAA